MSLGFFFISIPVMKNSQLIRARQLVKTKKYFGLTMTCLALSGCVLGPDFQQPKAPSIHTYTKNPLPENTSVIKNQEHKTQKFTFVNTIDRQWWQVFQNQSLNTLIEKGIRNNPTLQAAQASLAQAKENLNAEMGGLFPAIDTKVGGTRQKISQATYGNNGPSPIYNLYNVSLNISYSPDIFGALRRQIEALEAQVDYQYFELEAAYLTLIANVIKTVVQEALLRSQIDITKNLIASQEKQLHIMKAQYGLGCVSQTDLLGQEVLVAQTQSTLPSLENSLAQTRHALAVLVGDLPSEAQLPQFRLRDLDLPRNLPMVLPASLTQNRPDIKAAEALLHHANAQIGIAKAQMFPQLMLTGSLGGVSNVTNTLFAGSSDVWSVASQLIQPLFKGGAMMAKEDAAIAGYNQAFGVYQQTVLEAFQQVADILHALVENAKTHKAFVEAEQATHKTLEISHKQYRMGALSEINLLTIERQYYQVCLDRIHAEGARYISTISLFQALGGDCFALRDSQTKSSEIESIKSVCAGESES